MVAHALGDERRAGVSDAEALARLPVDVDRARRGAVGNHVAGDDIVLGTERLVILRLDGNHAAGERLADVVVRLAHEVELHSLGEKRAEGLPGNAGKVNG